MNNRRKNCLDRIVNIALFWSKHLYIQGIHKNISFASLYEMKEDSYKENTHVFQEHS